MLQCEEEGDGVRKILQCEEEGGGARKNGPIPNHWMPT